MCLRGVQGWSLLGAVDRERGNALRQERTSGHLRSLALLPTGLRHLPTPQSQSRETSKACRVALGTRFSDQPRSLQRKLPSKNQVSFTSWSLQRSSERPSHPLQQAKYCYLCSQGSVESCGMPATPTDLKYEPSRGLCPHTTVHTHPAGVSGWHRA